MWKGQGTWWQRTWVKLRYFTVKTCLQKSQILETNGKVWRKEDLLLVEKDLVRIRLKLSVLEALGPNWIYPKVLREMVNAILRVPSIYERSQQLAEFLKNHKKTNVPLRRARRTIRATTDEPVLTLIHMKVMKQVILENISEGSQQNGEWGDRNITKFKEKWQVPSPGRNNSRHFCHMRETKKAETAQPGKKTTWEILSATSHQWQCGRGKEGRQEGWHKSQDNSK